MQSNILIGNIISCVAALCLITSSIIKDKKSIYILQIMECLILSVAYIFFKAYSGMASLFICAVRNYFVVKDKYDKKSMYIFVIIILTLGIITNNRGLIGYIPVFASIQYSICQRYCKKIIPIKLMIFVNVTLWTIYAFIVRDYPTALFNGIASVSCLISTIYILIKYNYKPVN